MLRRIGCLLGRFAVASPALARAQAESVVQELELSEAIFPQEPGSLQWSAAVGLEKDGDDATFEAEQALQLGLLPGLELQGELPYTATIESDQRGMGNPSVGLLYAAVDETDVGLAVHTAATFASPSAGDDSFAYDVSVLGHMSVGWFHAQLSVGAEVQHGRALRAQGDDARVDPQASVALWAELNPVALIIEAGFEPEPDSITWRVGPTIQWQVLEPLTLGIHGDANFEGEEVELQGIARVIVETPRAW